MLNEYLLATLVFEARLFHVLCGLPTCEVHEVLNLPGVAAAWCGLYEMNDECPGECMSGSR